MTLIIFFGGCRKFLPAAYDQSLNSLPYMSWYLWQAKKEDGLKV